MQILTLSGTMYFDAVVVFVTSQTLLFRLALAILCSETTQFPKNNLLYFQDKYYELNVVKPNLSKRDEGKIVTECYKIPCDGLKGLFFMASHLTYADSAHF